MDEQLPSFLWRLSAPESLVLLWGPDTGDPWTLKVALLDLVVRRTLRLSTAERPRLLRSPARVNVLSAAELADPSLPRALQAVMEAYSGTRQVLSDGVPVVDLATAVFTRRFRQTRTGFLRKRWDRTGGGYVRTEVLPELERCGYYTRLVVSELAIFSSPHWRLTSTGEAALAELRRITAVGRGAFPEWVERDPELALSFVERAGPAILILGGVAPLLRRLRDRSGADGGSGLGWARDPFSAAELAGSFGPGPDDDLDTAFFALTADVDRAWSNLDRNSGGMFSAGGE
jgi:hypothetical protein